MAPVPISGETGLAVVGADVSKVQSAMVVWAWTEKQRANESDVNNMVFFIKLPGGFDYSDFSQ
jgi:hypothetical protein